MFYFTHEDNIEEEFGEWSSQFASNVSEGLLNDLNKTTSLLQICEKQKLEDSQRWKEDSFNLGGYQADLRKKEKELEKCNG